MTEKVCRCEATDNEKTEKNEAPIKTKEKLRLFSRKKSNSLNKNVCAKCGFPFATESPPSAVANSPKLTPQLKDELGAPAFKQQELAKKTKKQSEELPKIPDQDDNYRYEKGGSDEGDRIYTEIGENPEMATSAPTPTAAQAPATGGGALEANRRRPASAVRVQAGGQTRLSNGGAVFKSACDCPKCRRQRGQDLTVELLPMDTQITLQSMMQGSTLMCNLL